MQNHKKEKMMFRNKGGLLLITAAILLVVASLFGVKNFHTNTSLKKVNDPQEVPTHHKTLTNNRDGTFSLELSVEGAIEPSESTAKANVLVVFDVSSSMTTYGRINNVYFRHDKGQYGTLNEQYITLYYKRPNGTYRAVTDNATEGPVYYASGSDYLEYTGARFEKVDSTTRGAAAERVVYEFSEKLFGYNTQDQPDNVQMALVTFSGNTNTNNNSHIVSGWTNSTSFLDHFHSDGKTIGLKYSSGTNWEAALDTSITSVLSQADPDNTFVIFITDGAPNRTIASPNSSVGNANAYAASKDEALNINNYDTTTHTVNAETSNTKLYGIYAYGDETDYLDDLIYYAYNNSDIPAGTTNVPNYFKAERQEDVDNALVSIFSRIVDSLGITDEIIADGTTSNVKLTSGEVVDLLTIDNNSFSYWMSKDVYPYVKSTQDPTVTAQPWYVGDDVDYDYYTDRVDRLSGQVFYVYTKDLGNNQLQVSWNRPSEGVTQHSITVEGTIADKPTYDENVTDPNHKIMKVKWEANSETPEIFFNQTPPPAKVVSSSDSCDPEVEYCSGTVEWDLTSLDSTLLNGVTYSVKFDVWKTQLVFDLIADLENGEIDYSELGPSSTGPYQGLDQFIEQTCTSPGNCSYSLKTNTQAMLTYKDTREENPEDHHTIYGDHLDGIPVYSDAISITKEWKNYIADREDPTSVTIQLLMDDKPYITRTLSESNNWTNTRPAYVSYGLMKLDTNTGKVEVLDPGHDYSFAEFEGSYYNYQVVSETVHPMILNGEFVRLVKLDNDLLDQFTLEDNPQADYKIPDAMNNPEVMYATSGNKEFIRLTEGGQVYFIRHATNAKIFAYNYRRSNLNIFKTVENDSVPENSTYKLNINVNDPGNTYLDPEATDPEHSVKTADLYFSVCETGKDCKNASDFIDLEDRLLTTAWQKEYDRNNNWTGYYYAPNNTPLSVNIKENENIRFTNLTTKATYSVEEDVSSLGNEYLFDTIELTGTHFNSEGVEGTLDASDLSYTLDKPNHKLTGEINLTNSIYNVEVKNIYELVDVEAVKDWDDNDDQDGIRKNNNIDTVYFQLYKKVGTGQKEAVGQAVPVTEDDQWKHSWPSLPKYQDNDLTKEIIYTVEEVVEENSILDTEYDQTVVNNSTPGKYSYTIKNTHEPETINISGDKTWDDANNQDGVRPGFIRVKLIANGDEEHPVATQQVVPANGQWHYSFTGVDKYKDGEEITYTISEETVDYYSLTNNGGYNIKNTHTPFKTGIVVVKNWDDYNNQDKKRPESISFILSANGVPLPSINPITITAEDNWTYTNDNLPRKSLGEDINYTISEINVTGYNTTSTVTTTYPTETTSNPYSDKVISIGVDNTHELTKISVEGEKTWDDDNNRDGIRPPSITVNLLADGVSTGKTATVTPNAEGKWKYKFENLQQYRNGEVGVPIVYTVTETHVNGYTPTYNGMNISNYHQPTKISISGEKTWEDNNNQDGIRPPSITVSLLANGQPTGKTATVTPDAEGKWKYTFDDLYEKENGTTITYTVAEEAVAGYTPTTNGYNIVNTHQPSTITVSGVKTWDDADNQDGSRPPSITVSLLANGQPTGKTAIVTPDAEGKWLYSFAGVPEYSNGQKITYTVSETVPEGYTPTYDGMNVTNSYTPQKTFVEGEKTWDDDSNRDRLRPDTITVKLFADGVDTGKTYTVSENEDGKWMYRFDDLDMYKDGQKIIYTVQEAPVTNYTPESTGYNIKNIHNPFNTGIVITKEWSDDDNRDGIRPSSVSFIVKADGIPVATIGTVTLDSSNNWTYTNTTLPRKHNGIDINYTVEEIGVSGYDLTTQESETYPGGVVAPNTSRTYTYAATNTHEPEKITIEGTKTWDDNNNQDGLRPTSITFNLYADGQYVRSTTTNSSNWNYKFTDLDKYKDGEVGHEIVYTVTESPVSGYQTTQNGYNFTNKHTPETTSISGTKTWDDNNDQDGIRPISITVNLLVNGNYTGISKSVTADTEGNWNYKFDNLPKYMNGSLITYSVVENLITGYTTTYDGNNITNKHTPEKTYVEGNKVWDDNNNQDGIRPASVTIKLVADGVETGDTTTATASTNWTYSFTDLPKYNNGNEISYSVKEVPIDNYTTTISGNTITNKHVPATTKVEGSKTWDDNNNQDGIRPASIQVNLFANGAYIKSTIVTADTEGNWNYKFEDLPKKANGTDITYTVTENPINGYTATINGKNITNKHVPEKTSISGTKTWDDNNDQDGIRPDSVTIKLLADGVETGKTTTATATSDWKYSFTDLPKYKEGNEISYSVKEVPIDNYTTTISGTNITNKHVPAKTAISGTKTWSDGNNQDGLRPTTITVNLFANGAYIKSTTATANDWTYSFTDLPKYSNGTEIAYTITENPVDGYTTTINGTSITNTHTPATTTVEGEKVWSDNDNQDGLRPASVTIKLYNGSQELDSTTATAATNWKYSFTDLPKYSNGTEINYTVVEESVTGYTPTISGTTITNTHTPEKTKVEGIKVWDDNNDQDGKRPDTITVNLFANGAYTGKSTTTSAANEWKYKFENLDKYLNGSAITYTVTENPIDGYSTTITGTNITNKHVPETTTISGEKTWDDNNNQDGVRPTHIVVNLKVGTEVVRTQRVSVDGEGKWKYSFTDLPKYDNKVEINYVVEEEPVDYYTPTTNGYNITNTHSLFETGIIITKDWNDSNNTDGIRPQSATFILKADGVIIPTERIVLSASNNWTYTNNNLPRKANGRDIVYTIEEVPIAGYTVNTVTSETYPDPTNTINSNKLFTYSVTNTHPKEKTTVSGTKTWADNNNQDGKRPDSITVNLLADGEPTGLSQVATASTNWQYSFSNLNKYRDGSNGQEIVYTVQEEAVEGYTPVYNGMNITNTHSIEKTKVEGTKVWADNNNQDGIRPTSVTINLLANGNYTGKSKTVTANDNWNYSFTNLDKYLNGQEITYTVTENQVDNYTTTISGTTIKNTHTPEKTSIEGVKVWSDNNNQDGKRPESVTIKLLADGVETGDTTTATATSNWTYSFTNLDKYKDGNEIAYTVDEVEPTGYTKSITGTTITNTHIPEKTKVEGIKVWSDNNDQDGKRPDTITINLLANGSYTGKSTTTSEANEWKYSFSNLDKYLNGQEISYTVVEDAIEGYTTTISGTTITNTHTPEKTSIEGTKVWKDNDNQDGARPESVTIKLLADGVETGDTTTATATSKWTYSFTNLDKYKDGNEISYTVVEVVPTNYTAAINNTTITNTHTPETTKVEGVKVWSDNNDQDGLRPDSIKVNLFGNGNFIESKNITPNNGEWKYSFTNLPKYKDGVEITYTITEDPISGYTTTISGTTITNTHTPEKTSIEGVKVWSDNNNQDGLRPDSVTIKLLADGVDTGKTTTATSTSNWQYSFTNLDKYKDGNEIAYTVDEEVPTGYTKSISGTTITNTHTPETTKVEGEKVWSDGDNQDGLRPASITINLFGNGNFIESKNITPTNGEWKYSFTNLPKYSNGSEITYTVTENPVNGYITTISGTTITNTHTPEKTSIEGVKVWSDNDNQDGLRPASVTIKLIADGVETGDTTTATATSNWTYSFTNLDKYKDGNEIVYTVDEVEPTGYTKSISGTTITNTHTPITTKVEGEKVWSDGNNQDGIRPTFINVSLLANGVVTQTKQVSAATNWQYSFTNLPMYESGSKITYTVDEDAVAGYTKSTSGYDITNTHTPETTTITGNKTWNDNENQDGVRPDSITINLLADGSKVDEQTISKNSDGTWPTYSFENKPVYNNGKKITYTVTENDVTHYTSTNNNFEVTNTHSPFTTEVSVQKIWDDDYNRDNLRPGSITVILKADGVAITDRVVLNTQNEWFKKWTGLNRYANGKEIEYTVEEVNGAGSTYKPEVTTTQTTEPGTKADNSESYIITNKHTFETVDVEGQKIWDDNDNQDGKRPESITVILKADNEEIDTKTVTSQDNWNYSWTGLPKYQTNAVGHQIRYTVEEAVVPEGYTQTVNRYNITNKHTPEKTSISGTKVWADNNDQDGIRPQSVTIELYADGVAKTTTTATASTNWTYSFNNLDKYKNGKEITYTVNEISIPNGYTPTVEGTTITNTHTPATTYVEGKKVWADNNDQDGIRPTSIIINVMDGTTVVKQETINKPEGDTNEWSFKIEGLPKYKDKGTLINYTIDEVLLTDKYTKEITGTTITNTHIPTTVDVPITKTWIDNSNQELKRPESISVSLKADEKVVATETITGTTNTWEHTFKDLPKYRDHGIEIKYTVVENNVDTNYTVSYPQDRVIVNTIKDLEREIPVTKVWDDNNNNDGKRPTELTVTLTGTVKEGGVNKEVHSDSIVLKATEDWKNKFEKVPIFYKGQVISYTINEVLSGNDYTNTNVTGDVKTGYTITNTHTLEQTEITATKVWDDSNNNDGLRPDNVTIILNDEKGEVDRKTITESDNWQVTFTGIPKYRDGQEINYSVTEETVEGYTPTINTETRTITNSHTPLRITYEINKIWDDYDNQDGKRPDAITVRLYADEVEIDHAVITADEYGNWKYTFTDLPKYDNGRLIKYTITEENVELYEEPQIITNENTKEVMEMNAAVINTHELIPYNETGKITVNKIWVDENDKYNKRPSGITVRLYANGVEFRVATLNASNNWTYTFTDLPKYEPGKVGVEVEYTIKEDQIINYYSKIDNYTIINTYNGPRTQRTEIIPPHTGIETQQDSYLFEILMLIVSLGYTLTISLRTNE